MRTYKRTVINLDHNDHLEIMYRDHVIQIDVVHDGEHQYLVLEMSGDHNIANLTAGGRELGFTELENGMQEVGGPISFIAFNRNSE